MDDVGVALDLRGVSKRYPGTLAVRDVDLRIRVGEVHALVGENGAGKSTLVKIIAGCFADYAGAILMNGKPVDLHSPALATRAGIAMIHQELSLAPPLSVAENVLAGRLPARAGVLARRAMLDETRQWLAMVGLASIDPRTPVEDLAPHEAQRVEIAKALAREPCILVMDEPTSALSRQEVERLFAIIRDLRRHGLAIVYISHHLAEIFEVADRVSVMRDGRLVGTHEIGEVTSRALVGAMLGGAAGDIVPPRTRRIGEVTLRVEGLTRRGFFHDCSFEVRAGEIVGIAGVSGAGRTELARALCGIDARDGGRIVLGGRECEAWTYGDAICAGLAYVAEDRKTQGLALRLSVAENLLAAVIPRHCRAGIYRRAKDAPLVARFLGGLGVEPPEPAREIATLSGGNQQKVLLGKWLATEPRVLVLDEPTRGVDVGAKAVIHRAIAGLADEGRGVVVISSDLPELVGLSDRVLVMRRGRFVRELAGPELDERAVLLAAVGEG
jgi:ABC-type sugar transport system ATPase subunit